MTDKDTAATDEIDLREEEAELAIDEFFAEVDRGMTGGNIGLRVRNPKIQKYINGLHRGRNYLFGADSGVGKTTEVDDLLLDAWEDAQAKNVEFKSIYYSFEISRTQKLARWCSRWIFKNKGLPMDADYILGRKEGMLMSEEDRTIVEEAKVWLREVLKDIKIIETVKHPTAILAEVIEYMEKNHGIVERIIGKDGKSYVRKFIPKNRELFMFLVIDHLALLHEEAGMDTKKTIDRMSKYSVMLRNIFGISAFFIQQFNTELQSTQRANKLRQSENSFAPQRLDFGDSRYTYRDADVVFGLIKPQKYDLDTFDGYDLLEDQGVVLGDYLVPMYLMKNRYGVEDRIIEQVLIGSAGTFLSAPEPENMLFMDDLKTQLREIQTRCQNYQPKL